MQSKFTLFLGAFLLAATGNFSAGAAPQVIHPETAVAPRITVEPASVTVAASHVANFSIAASGTAPLSYQWYKNGAPISGATTSRYTTPATTSADNGAGFYVIVKNSVSSVGSNYAYLTVGDPPVIAGQPGSVAVTLPNFAFFSVSAYGTQPLNFQWYKNGVAIPGANASSYPTGEITTADNGATYFVTVKNSFGNAKSKTATLTVKPAAPGTYPIVGYWSGTATSTRADGTTKTAQISAAFSQTSFSLTGSIVLIDGNGTPHYDLEIASLNGQNLYLVKRVTVNGATGLVSLAAGFTPNLLSMNFIAGGGEGSNAPLGVGSLTLSSDLQTLTGTANSGSGSISLQLTRDK